MAENGKQEPKLTTRQQRAIAALLANPTVQGAAKTAGIGERTLHTWLKDPTFTQGLHQAESEALNAASRELLTLASKARASIEEVLNDPKASPMQKLRAADIVYSRLLQLRELASLEDRVSKLEEAANAKK